jgi:hypothetical protein
MPTPKELRQQAKDCLQLAKEAPDVLTRASLLERADELRNEAKGQDQTRGEHGNTSGGRDASSR